MAKVLFTAIVADMRNKLNGSVFSKNRYGAYVRTKVTPVNPQTDAQQNVRNQFATASQAWRGLSEAQRQSFIDAAPAFPVFDIFGNSKILSGSALYNKLNLNLSAAGVGAIDTAPSPAAIPPIIGLSLTATVTGPVMTLTSDTAVVPAGTVMIVQATPLYGPGISFVKNKYRQIATVAAAGTIDTHSIYTTWNAIFGALVEGQKVSVRIFLVNETTGQAGIALSATAIVGA